jgi:hypothetical protein
MTEPTEDEVLVKAKQRARDDGRLSDTEDIENVLAARDRFADDSLRAEYLNRVRELLRHEKI